MAAVVGRSGAGYQVLAGTLGDCGAGTSMGAALALEVAMRHRSVVGVICVNPKVVPESADTITDVRGLLEDGMEQLPGRNPTSPSRVWSSSVIRHAARTLLSMWDGLSALDDRLPRATPAPDVYVARSLSTGRQGRR